MNYLRVYAASGGKAIPAPTRSGADTPMASTSTAASAPEPAGEVAAETDAAAGLAPAPMPASPAMPATAAQYPDTAAAASSRSRASSIFSTGTKTSINTLPPRPPRAESHAGPIDIVVGRRNFRITARPGSILSISSFDHPAPPYSEAVGAPASQSTATLTASSVLEEDRNAGDADVEQDEAPTIEQPTPIAPAVQPLVLAGADEDDGRSERQESSAPTSRSHSPPSPPMSPLSSSTNAISAHYTAVVRAIDTNHRAEMELVRQEHEAALAQMRNDIDAAYRIPFREARHRAEACAAEADANKQLADERSQHIESLKAEKHAAEKELGDLKISSEKRIQALQHDITVMKHAAELMKSSGETDLLRARNEVEDVWEGRWRDRMRLAAEQVKRSWEDGRERGLQEGMLQGRQHIEAVWERVEGRPLPQNVRQELDNWTVETTTRKRRDSRSPSSTSAP